MQNLFRRQKAVSPAHAADTAVKNSAQERIFPKIDLVPRKQWKDFFPDIIIII